MIGEEHRLRDDFVERNPHWKWRIDNYASIKVRGWSTRDVHGPHRGLILFKR